ncbi:hypothetical protein B4110_0335 [Parageobacillus toebii]|uniref:Uncharacterized protein n=1 Tax=Parageobacillus toebii TaxID=153151 RepID=A0A150N723_9BACL|nr:hypothetical protein B4110_0335 [Parageobacillus toebii]
MPKFTVPLPTSSFYLTYEELKLGRLFDGYSNCMFLSYL